MWTWQQAPHSMLDPTGNVLDRTGYSGKGAAKNDPDQQCSVDQGPIPRGRYAIGLATNHPRLGPLTIPLTPDAGNDMCQRSGFFIHGDSVSDPGNASEGCIILPKASRVIINSGTDKTLEVVRGVMAATALDASAAVALAESAVSKPRPKVRPESESKRPVAKRVRSRRVRRNKATKKSPAPKTTKSKKKRAGKSKRQRSKG